MEHELQALAVAMGEAAEAGDMDRLDLLREIAEDIADANEPMIEGLGDPANPLHAQIIARVAERDKKRRQDLLEKLGKEIDWEAAVSEEAAEDSKAQGASSAGI